MPDNRPRPRRRRHSVEPPSPLPEGFRGWLERVDGDSATRDATKAPLPPALLLGSQEVAQSKRQAALSLLRAGAVTNLTEAAEAAGVLPGTLRSYLHRHPEEKAGLNLHQGRRRDPDCLSARAAELVRAGASQEDAAGQVGVSQAAVSKWIKRQADKGTASNTATTDEPPSLDGPGQGKDPEK